MNKRNVLFVLSTIGILIITISIFTNRFLRKIEEQTYVKSAETKTPEQVNVKSEKVYFKELSVEDDIKRFYYNPTAMYSYSLLYYNRRIYTSSGRNSSNNNKDKPHTRMLSKVYGNNTICWSEDSSMLTDVTEEGRIYKVNGYSEEDRICLFCKKEPKSFQKPKKDVYIKQYFDCLNGIYLLYGKDLYVDILHLEDTKNAFVSSNIMGDGKKKISVKGVIFKELMEVLYESKFLKPDIMSDLEDDLEAVGSCILELEDGNGIKSMIEIYLNGYVVFESPDNQYFISEIDEQICKKVYNIPK